MSVLEILKQWGDKNERVRMFAKLKDPGILKGFLDAMESFYGEYEEPALDAMYRRVANAIRKVDQNHLLLLEPGPGSITGVRSHLRAVVDDADNATRGKHSFHTPTGCRLWRRRRSTWP